MSGARGQNILMVPQLDKNPKKQKKGTALPIWAPPPPLHPGTSVPHCSLDPPLLRDFFFVQTFRVLVHRLHFVAINVDVTAYCN